jgi:response regulator RpfG family c-di-GMP phosphodiesterase
MVVRMPVMDGLEATASIRAMTGPKSNILIIALTADIAADNITEFTNAGMNDVCGKPIELPLLLRSINKCLGEEIHTSFSQASAFATSQQVDDLEASLDDSGEITSFGQVLLRVANIVNQTIGQNKDTDIPSTTTAIGETTFTELLKMYEEGLKGQCDVFKKAIFDLSYKPTDRELKENAVVKTHSIMGISDSFNYHLITTIATSAAHILKDKESFTAGDVELLNNHAKALELVSIKKMSGNGGKPGRILLQGLNSAS